MSKISIEKQVELIEQYMDEGNLCEANQVLRDLEARALKDQQKLSELTHGIPIEKADKEKEYLYWYFGGTPVVAEWSKEEKRWFFFYRGRTHTLVNAIVYPLPSQNSQTQEGS